MPSTSASSQPLSLRLGDQGRRALEDIARRRGITRAEAARQAIAETAERERRRSGLAAEAARLAADPADRAVRERVAADMDAVAAAWPE
jgi:predicted transcriptional regulator